MHCLKNVRIRSYSGPHFPAFGLNMGKSLCIQSECWKMWTRTTPNTDTFYAVQIVPNQIFDRVTQNAFHAWLTFDFLKKIFGAGRRHQR